MIYNKKRIAIICIALYIFAEAVFLFNIQYPSKPNFDEVQYIPSSKIFLEMKEYRNAEHPPLAKEIMAIGLAAVGDNPYGWRVMSTIFGSLTLVAMFLLGTALFKDEQTALVATSLTFFNNMLYVQARIAMLDTFMAAFLLFALAAFAFSAQEKLPKKKVMEFWLISGTFFGCALACKWTPLFALLPTVALVLFAKRLKKLNLWQQNSIGQLILCFFVLPFAIYWISFIPVMFFDDHPLGFFDIFSYQAKMYDLQTRVVGGHPYLSSWTTWPFMQRPIWYAFDKDGAWGQYIRGVIMLGNPLIMWGGLIALIVCLYRVFYKKENYLIGFFVLYYWASLYFCWGVFPRKVAFFYYYYPAAFMLSLAIAYVLPKNKMLRFRGFALDVRWLVVFATAVLFVYFLPILGAFQIGAPDFMRWMWLHTWI